MQHDQLAVDPSVECSWSVESCRAILSSHKMYSVLPWYGMSAQRSIPDRSAVPDVQAVLLPRNRIVKDTSSND